MIRGRGCRMSCGECGFLERGFERGGGTLLITWDFFHGVESRFCCVGSVGVFFRGYDRADDACKIFVDFS